jgi:hypothetical protein
MQVEGQGWGSVYESITFSNPFNSMLINDLSI